MKIKKLAVAVLAVAALAGCSQGTTDDVTDTVVAAPGTVTAPVAVAPQAEAPSPAPMRESKQESAPESTQESAVAPPAKPSRAPVVEEKQAPAKEVEPQIEEEPVAQPGTEPVASAPKPKVETAPGRPYPTRSRTQLVVLQGDEERGSCVWDGKWVAPGTKVSETEGGWNYTYVCTANPSAFPGEWQPSGAATKAK